MRDFQCPKCAKGKLIRDDKLLHCQLCGFVYYHNVASAVAAVINCGQHILLTVRKHDPCAGMLDFPGGFVDYDESAEEAIARELKEELDITPRSMRYLFSIPNTYMYAETKYKTLDLFFSINVPPDVSITPADDVAGYTLIQLHDIKVEDIGLDSIKLAVSKLRDGIQAGK